MITKEIIENRIDYISQFCQTKIRSNVNIESIADYFIVTIHGGNNGYGRLTNYLSDLKLIVDQFDDTWLIDWTNDCVDDIWYFKFAVR